MKLRRPIFSAFLLSACSMESTFRSDKPLTRTEAERRVCLSKRLMPSSRKTRFDCRFGYASGRHAVRFFIGKYTRVLVICLILPVLAMAQSPEIQTVETDPHARYLLQPVSTTGPMLPGSALFVCFQGEKQLGYTSFIFSPATDPAVWAFWKPVLENIAERKEFALELDGGRFVVNPMTQQETMSGWTMALPAPSQEEANIEILTK